jgi:hypothetical protein
LAGSLQEFLSRRVGGRFPPLEALGSGARAASSRALRLWPLGGNFVTLLKCLLAFRDDLDGQRLEI